MINVVKMADNPPQVSRTKPVYVRAEQVLKRWSVYSGPGLAGAEADLAKFDSVLPAAEAIQEELRSAARAASRQDIVNHLTMLVGCFSNGSVHGEIYARTLAEYVAEMEPTIGELEHACRHMLRTRTSPFQPTIAEVLKVLEESKRVCEHLTREILRISKKDRIRYVEDVEQERQKHELKAIEEQQCRQRRLEKYGEF